MTVKVDLSLDFTSFSNIIDGKLTQTDSTRRAINPATGEELFPCPVSTPQDVEDAIKAARAAFGDWKKTPVEHRRQQMKAFSAALLKHKAEFADLLTKEQGKATFFAEQEVELGASWLGGMCAVELQEEIVETTPEVLIRTRYTPLGVAVGIIPWNFPVMLLCGKIAPALLTGNCLIIKPSPFTPYCGIKIVELAQAFFPPGVVQVVSGNDSLGPWLTCHPGIDKISFTGSTATGKRVMESAMKRIFVHKDIYAPFRDAFVASVENFKVGSGVEKDVFIGPVQNKLQYDRVNTFLDNIRDQGQKIATGGQAIHSKGNGYFIQPTVIDSPSDDSMIVTEEPFGPIVPLLQWSDDDEVIARANDTNMGLGSSVWSKNVDRAVRIGERLDVGSVWINEHLTLKPNATFGGHKQSGIGSEWGVDGLKAYCNTQTLFIKHSK